LIYILAYNFYLGNNLNTKESILDNYFKRNEYANKKFIIIQRRCNLCGLFSFYIVSLGCIHKFLLEGFIPIIDIQSFPNIINGFNIYKHNYWELFFEQPFGYTLESVLKNAKNITYINCDDCNPRPDPQPMLFNEPRKYFWHNFANKYMPIKIELINQSNKIIYILFKNSKNILGVLTRGTDYIAKKPKGHPIPPNITDIIHDVKKMDEKYNYDYIFFSTEDDNIRDKFINIFKNKVKQIKQKFRINYDYTKKDYINLNKNIIGNVEFNKIYLINIIILSKCLDIVTARCSATAGIFIMTNGFRNMKIYDLGVY
jgi:hypothetical protein